MTSLRTAGVLAHGVGGRSDLPLELWQVTFGAAAAVAASFAVLGLAWRTPRLRRWAAGRLGPLAGAWLSITARAVGIGALALVVSVALLGPRSSRDNLAPVWIYVVFWVGVPVVSAAFGDVWRHVSPWRTIGRLVSRGRPTVEGSGPTVLAAIVLLGFAWLELAYHEPDDVRFLGVVAVGYTLVMALGARRWGLSWVDDNEGFGVLFGLIARLSPITATDRRVRLRFPLAGLAEIVPTAGTVIVVSVALGSTTFDGLTRTEWWGDVVGRRVEWAATMVNTGGLVVTIAAVAVVYLVAARLGDRLGRGRSGMVVSHAPSLVPIALAYAVAHYFSLLVFEGQSAWNLLSDPYGEGWDLFGRTGERIDYLVVSTTTIAWVQVAAIVLGHVGATVFAHDRTLELVEPRRAQLAQYPLLIAMIGYTVTGLVLLLNS